jgi:ADP-ribose pyrophosphatase YjhB (NUDIX family)
MIKPSFIQENDWEGSIYKFEIYLASDFSQLSGIKQVYGAVLDDKDRLLIISQDGKNWGLPGGTVEAGETLLDTLDREVYEEAAVVINPGTIKPFFYQKVYSKVDNEWKHTDTQVRFVCRLARQDKFVKDPDEEKVKYQKFVNINDLDKFLKWGETTGFIQKEVLKAAKQ